jgi:hypothetical protein
VICLWGESKRELIVQMPVELASIIAGNGSINKWQL